MKELIKKTRILWLLIVAVSFFGCEDDDVANLPEVVASFVHTINEDTGVVSFENLSENADSYTWDFGDDTTSTEINPIKVYGSGTYTVVLTAENAAGASDTFEDTIVIDIPLPVNIPITFDDSGVNYGSIQGFDTQFQVIDNPELSGANDVASKVGEIVSNGVDFQGITLALGAPIDFGGAENTIQLKLYSTVVTDMLVKFSNGVDGARDTEVKVTHGGTGWELLDFNFATDAVKSFIDGDPENGQPFVPTGQYQNLDLFVGFAGGGVADTFYIDDIIFTETEVVAPTGPTTAAPTPPARDAADVISLYSDAYANVTVSEWSAGWDDADITDETAAGDNVKKVIFGDSGGFLGVDFSANAFDATAFTHFHMDYWVADEITSGQILNPKWSNHDNAGEVNAFEYTNPVSQSGEWVSIDIPITDFGGDTTRDNIAQFILASGATLDEVYFDNVYFYKEGGGGATCTAETSQSLAGADLNLTFMSDPSASIIEDGGDFEWIDNPDFENAVNTSCKVGKITKLGNNPWDNNQIDLDAKLDFNNNSGLKIKVWSAKPNTEVRIKLEEIGNPGNNTEQFLITSVTSAWEELTFPFSSADSDKFDKIVIFFDLNAENTDTYYFDDLMLYGDGGGTGGGTGGCTSTPIAATSFPVNFEGCESFLSTFTDSGSITTELADNPAKTGINTSDFVLKVVKATGTNRWAGFQNPFPSNFDATKTFKVKIYSSKANVVMKFEVNSDPQSPDSGNPGPQYATITNANTWTEVEIIFTGIPGSNTGLNQLVIKPDNPDGTDGELTDSEGVYYFDDIRLE